MAAPFAFLPRAVSKHTKEWQGISRSPPSPSPPDPTTDSEFENDETDTSSVTPSKAKGKDNAIELAHSKHSTMSQDIASLISLALSDYTIWLDADLRWKLNACLGDETADEAGYVPVNYLLRRAPFRGALLLANGQPDPSETEVVKALRTHASHTLEVRMRLPCSSSSVPSSSVWYGTGKTSRKKDVGGYEVRRRDWPTLRDRLSLGWTRARWDAMTAYMECIPAQYRTIGAISRFAESLLPPPSDTELGPRIQAVTLPPHYLDTPEDTPKCKGYGLVTFSTRSHVEAVLRAWPWERRRASVTAKNGDEDTSSLVREAHQYGLRTISKARWDALNEEYLFYRQHLVDEIGWTQPEMHHPDDDATERKGGESNVHGIDTPSQPQTQTTSSSPYPFNCLVFVRNIHPETNKTTLKALFTQAFDDGTGLDYVDYTKGMDTCYLRLASAHHAARLTAWFDTQRRAQAHGLDGTGRTPTQDDKSITMEGIQGTKEELYWEKVPEKIRRQAVDKAVNGQFAPVPESSALPAATNGQKKRTRDW